MEADSELNEIVEIHDVDEDEAEEIRVIKDELGVDDDDAYTIWEAM